MHRYSQCPDGWQNLTFGDVTIEQNLRVGALSEPPIVLSCTKHYGLVPSNEYFKNRTIYSNDLTAYKRVMRDWFSYATNHLAEGSIGRQLQFDDSCVSPIYTVFSCNTGVFPPYLERVLKSTPVLRQYKIFEQATVDRRGAVRYLDFARIPVQLPPEFEQVKISVVLDTLDTVIRQTEAIIEKLKQVKQGLLHDLLTRGIGANGELRLPQVQAPYLYKDSALGTIPNEWNQVSLGNMLLGIDGGWSPECIEQSPKEGEWGVLKISAISSGTYRPFESKTLPPHLQPDTSIEVSVGDVLLTRANGVADLVAVTAYVDVTPSRLMLSDKTLRLRPKTEVLSGRFLATLMSFHTIRKQIGGMLNGSSGQRNISQGQIANLSIVLPPLTEQHQINQRLAAVTERIAMELAVLEKLYKQKKGLMNDLLTGRVRVTPLLETLGA